MKKFVTKQEIEQARQLDLLSYLQRYEPDELVKVAPDVYSTRSNDSLKISNGRWFRWSRGYGGVSALDYLLKVREMDFVSAVQLLNNSMGYIPPPPVYTTKPPEKKPFLLPEANENNDRVFKYLTARGLSERTVKMFVDMGFVYEDRMHNCVFVGYDENNEAKYAMLRSSAFNSTFMREVEGSDKRYSFCLPLNRQKGNTLYVFESAIDCLSFIDMQCMKNGTERPENYLSLSGVYQPRENAEDTPLPLALAQYLKTYPDTEKIRLCLDRDDAGIRAAQTLLNQLRGKYDITYMPPLYGKDYNDMLMAQRGMSAVVRTRGLKEELLR